MRQQAQATFHTCLRVECKITPKVEMDVSLKRQDFSVFKILRSNVLLVLMLFSQSVFSAGTTVFINELHYDNAGTDSGEFIEIAGPSGTDPRPEENSWPDGTPTCASTAPSPSCNNRL